MGSNHSLNTTKNYIYSSHETFRPFSFHFYALSHNLEISRFSVFQQQIKKIKINKGQKTLKWSANEENTGTKQLRQSLWGSTTLRVHLKAVVSLPVSRWATGRMMAKTLYTNRKVCRINGWDHSLGFLLLLTVRLSKRTLSKGMPRPYLPH